MDDVFSALDDVLSPQLITQTPHAHFQPLRAINAHCFMWVFSGHSHPVLYPAGA
jgi:hypothetical protein